MSSGVDVRRRPGIWSYFSFNSGPRRRTSVSLPRSNNDAEPSSSRSSTDPFEKPARTRSGNLAFMDKASTMNQGRQARYLKTGGIVAFILLVLYFIAPRDRIPTGSFSSGGGNTAAKGAESPKCTKSYSKDKPLIQYALMIDAGSTGSRIHIYKFNNCGPSPELENEVFEMTAKIEGKSSGLSAYADDPEAAAKSLDVLMDKAVESVPETYRSCSPVALKATAGLRKVGEERSKKILEAVRHRLENAYPFPVVSEKNGGVEVMGGEQEGVYAWITTNYLLGKIGGPDKTPTAAVLDLGGGSTQIVFQPTFKDDPTGGMPKQLAEGDHKYELKFGGREFTLYQHSYLGYGLMEARNNMHKVFLNNLYEEKKEEGREWLKKPISHPCLIAGTEKEVEVAMGKDHALGETVTVKFTGPANGSPALCRGLAEKTLLKEAECKIAPCSFNGVHQPPFEQTFAREDVYLLSYFYDRTEPLGMPESFTLSELRDLTNRVCAGEEAWGVFHGMEEALKELNERPQHCLDLSFQLALLHTGYGMPIDREVKIAKKLKGNELGWCLGASLPLLSQESGWQCKVKKIT